MRTFNLRLILILFAIFLVGGITIHLVHRYQVRRNAEAFRDMATSSQKKLKEMVDEGASTQRQIQDAAEQTILYYRRYLGFVPDDLAVRIEYVNFLMEVDPAAAYMQNERVLRETATTDELKEQQQEMRVKQVVLARAYQQFTDALFHVDKLLEDKPNDAELLELRGILLTNLEETRANQQQAVESFTKAIAAAPDRITAYANLAALQRDRLRDRTAARATIAQMIEKNPESAMAYVVRAEFLLRLEDALSLLTIDRPTTPADSGAEDATQNEPETAAPAAVASDAEAEAAIAETIDIHTTKDWLTNLLRPNLPENLSTLRPAEQKRIIRRETVRLAIADAQHAMELDPKYALAPAIASDCWRSLGRLVLDATKKLEAITKARDLLQQAIALNDEELRYYGSLAELELELSAADRKRDMNAGIDAAVAALRAGLAADKSNPPSLDLRWQLASLLYRAKRERQEADKMVAEMENELVELRRVQPNNPTLKVRDAALNMLKAQSLVADQQWKQAQETYEAARETLLGDTKGDRSRLIKLINNELAVCYLQLGKQEKRLEMAEAAVRENPTDESKLLDLARAYREVGRVTDAARQYQAIIGLERATLLHFKEYAQVLLLSQLRKSPDQQQWDPLLRLLDEIELNTTEGDPDVPIMRAEIAIAQQDMARAEQILVDASQKYPNQMQYFSALIQMAQKQDDMAKAEERLEQLQERFGDSADTRMAEARLILARDGKDGFGKLDELTKNMEEFNEATRQGFYWQLCQTCVSRGFYKEGLKYGMQAIALAGDSLRLRQYMLDIARLATDVEAAEQLAEEIDGIENNGEVTHYAGAIASLTRYLDTIRAARDAIPEDQEAERVAAMEKASKDNVKLLTDAQGLLAVAAEKDPTWSDVPALQGNIAIYQGDEPAAVGYYRRAIELGNRNPNVAYQVAQALHNQGRYLEADMVVRNLEERTEELPLNMAELASRINYQRQEYDRALDLARPLTKSHDADALGWIGWLEMVNERYDDAEKSLRQAIEAAPEEPGPWTSLVRCLVLAGREEEAQQVLDEAITKIESRSRASAHAACLQMMGKNDEAERMYREALAAEPDSPSWLLRAAATFFITQPKTVQEGQSILERFVSGDVVDNLSPEDTQAWARRELASLLAQRDYKDYQRALQLVNENLAANPDSVEDLQLKAQLLAHRGEAEEKRESHNILQQLADKGLKLDPRSRFLLAQQYLNENSQQGWQQYQSQMLELFQDERAKEELPQYRLHYLEQLLRRDQIGQAQGIVSAYAQDQPNQIGPVLLRARVLAMAQRPQADQSLTLIQQAVENPEIKPTDKSVKTLSALGELQRIEGLLKARMQYMRNSLENATENTNATDSLAQTLRAQFPDLIARIEAQLPPISAAIDDYYQKLITADPSHQLLLVARLASQEKLPEAIELIKQHWQTSSPATLANAVSAVLTATNLDEADQAALQQLLEQAVTQHEGTDDGLPLMRLLSSLYVDRHIYDKAIEQYQKVLARYEKDVTALNNAAVLMAAAGTDLPKALEYIQRARDIVGPSTMILDSQAMVLLASGKPQEAISALQEAVAKKPEGVTRETAPALARSFGTYYFHLALAYQADGNLTAAAQAFQNARELGFTEEDVFEPEKDKYRELVKAIGGKG